MKALISKQRHKFAVKRERGVALLFSLGILSLLMVLGMAFVTTSLMSHRVAMDNSTRTQAKTFALAGINRAAISIMSYQISAIDDGTVLPIDFTSVYSYAEDGTQDLLTTTILDKNKLSFRYDDGCYDYLSKCKGAWFYGSNTARWVYFRSGVTDQGDGTGKADDTDSPIIGRVAYRVLPNRGTLNLNYVLSGFIKREYYAEILNDDAKQVKMSQDMVREACFNRWGVDINELYLSTSDALQGGTKWEDLVAKSGDVYAIPGALDSFLNAYDSEYTQLGQTVKTEKDSRTFVQKKGRQWFTRWFGNGFEPSADEAYNGAPVGQSGDEFFHRFNLSYSIKKSGVEEKWYERLAGANENSDKAVEMLAQTPASYIVGDLNDTEIESGRRKDRCGIPYLKVIGKEKGSFKDIEERRKQVAANLNDYCDEDNIPTADPQASRWTPSTEVKYSGNERTPYINEYGVAGIFTADNTDGKIKVGLKSGIAVELIDIYKNSERGSMQVKTQLNLGLKFKLHVTANVSYINNGLPGSMDFTYETDTKEINCATASQKKEVTISNFTGFNSGYAIGYGSSDETSSINAVESADIEAAFKKAHPGYTVSGANIKSFKVEVTDLEFGVGGMVLKAGGENVDFVNAPNREKGWSKSFNVSCKGLADKVNVESLVQPFIIGAMEVKDPRQNLNINPDDGTAAKAKSENDFQKSDWYWEPEDHVQWIGYSTSGNAMTVTGSFNSGARSISDLFAGVKGKVNTYSRPNAPRGTKNDEYVDYEVTTDPAWVGDDRESHLSTAVIRNNVMRSPWELGAIHRGAAWETINIATVKNGSKHMPSGDSWSDNGTEYRDGDGAILDEIKMTSAARVMGKVNLNRMNDELDRPKRADLTTVNSVGTVAAKLDEIVSYRWMARALLSNLYLKQQLALFVDNPEKFTSAANLLQTSKITDGLCEPFRPTEQWHHRSQVLTDGNLDGLWRNLAEKKSSSTDAEQEEIIGKIINLLDVKESLPTQIRVLIVAQSIRDLGGYKETVEITKVFNGKEVSKKCKIGVFDVEKEKDDDPQYFDEITGEVKLIATFDRESESGRLRLLSIEYIE